MIHATTFRRTMFLLAWLLSAVIAVAASTSDVGQNTPTASMALAQSPYATPTSGAQPVSALVPQTRPVPIVETNEGSTTPAKARDGRTRGSGPRGGHSPGVHDRRYGCCADALVSYQSSAHNRGVFEQACVAASYKRCNLVRERGNTSFLAPRRLRHPARAFFLPC